MSKPVFVINFKAYEEATGESCVALAKALDEGARTKGARTILCVPFTELRAVVTAVSHAEVYAQHVDAVTPGAHTGSVTAAMVAATGAKGTLLNHSERRVLERITEHIEAATKAGLKVIVCAQDTQEAQVLRNYPVEFVAVEPPELIGGDVSVSTARPELISASVKQCPENLLVGAGVKTRADVQTSVSLGAKGVLIASGVVKSAKPREALLDLTSGW